MESPDVHGPEDWIYKLDNVSKEFWSGKRLVAKGCDQVCLRIVRGEFLAVTGESGSGKSTLLSLLGFLAAPRPCPQEGQFLFRVNGTTHDLRAALEEGIGSARMSRWRADHVGFVFQSYHLMNHLTAQANVELGARFASPDSRRGNTADALLAMLGMANFARKRTRDLSGGQKQRISVARALSKHPAIILADEPTGNLDIANKCLVLASLLIANAVYGATVVLVTHEIEHPALVASRSILMRDGRIVDDRQITPHVTAQESIDIRVLADRIAREGYPAVYAELKFE
ncbi:MAG: ABC transporter ATP-binding protein [Lentisphaerae bacterium]|nr:ABC transporter ATP-binding protein [Lentisphaerota bacterium]